MEKIFNSFYNSVIYDDRYKYIFEGLFHTILIALFAVIIGIIIGMFKLPYLQLKKYYKLVFFLYT